MISKEDKAIFDEAMLGVEPLNNNKKIPKIIPKLLSNKYQKPIYSNKYQYTEQNNKPISGNKIIKYSGNIANTRAYNKLKKGKIQPEDSIDLHGLTKQEAKIALDRFLFSTNNLSCIKIIHGKGLNNSNNDAVLKTFVANYLKNHPVVAAYYSCNKQHGSTGAVLVLLKRLLHNNPKY